MIHSPANITAECVAELAQLEARQTVFKNYARFLSRQTHLRTIDGIRGLMPLTKRPGVLSLLAGLPNPTTFPIEELSIILRSPTGSQPYSTSRVNTESVREIVTIGSEEISTALQYTFTEGLPELLKILAEFQSKEHGVKIDGVGLQLAMGNGSQDLIYKAFSRLLDAGDTILVEAPAYAGVLPILQTLEVDVVEVETDPHGVSVSDLRSTLDSWPVSKLLPKAIYTVPYGNNPSGATTVQERREAVLELAEKHDFLILEGRYDPYFYLYFGANERPQSYLSIENTLVKSAERQRRVVRFDSFSKVLSSGLGIGFVTGPPEIVKAINSHTSAANLQAATTTQALTLAILRHWGHAGFRAHITNIAEFYRAKRDVFDCALQKHFGEPKLGEWTKPEAGLFFWIKLNLPATESDSFDLIRNRALERGVLAVPGVAFYPSGRKTSYVRTSFSVLEGQDINEALRRLAEVVTEAIGKRLSPS